MNQTPPGAPRGVLFFRRGSPHIRAETGDKRIESGMARSRRFVRLRIWLLAKSIRTTRLGRIDCDRIAGREGFVKSLIESLIRAFGRAGRIGAGGRHGVLRLKMPALRIAQVNLAHTAAR